MRTWAVSSFWLLWIKLMWTFLYWTLCRHIFSFLFPESGIAGICMFYFVILRSHSTILHCPYQCLSLLVALFLIVNLFYFILFYFSHFSGCVIFLWFYFVFSWQQMMLSTCSYICWPFVHLMVKWLSLTIHFYWVFLLLGCRSSLHVMDKSSLLNICIKVFCLWLVCFILLMYFLSRSFKFWWKPYLNFFRLWLVLFSLVIFACS